MRRNLSILGALALFTLACHRAPQATPQQRAAMGPAVEARLLEKEIKVKTEITGPQAEHLKMVGPDLGEPVVELLAMKGTLVDFCSAGFVDIELSDGQAWRKTWKC